MGEETVPRSEGLSPFTFSQVLNKMTTFPSSMFQEIPKILVLRIKQILILLISRNVDAKKCLNFS
jgi:hypothetical protein